MSRKNKYLIFYLCRRCKTPFSRPAQHEGSALDSLNEQPPMTTHICKHQDLGVADITGARIVRGELGAPDTGDADD
jgi:hypothetical protein